MTRSQFTTELSKFLAFDYHKRKGAQTKVGFYSKSDFKSPRGGFIQTFSFASMLKVSKTFFKPDTDCQVVKSYQFYNKFKFAKIRSMK